MTEIDIVNIGAIIGIIIAYSELRYKSLLPILKRHTECIDRIEQRINQLNDVLREKRFKK